VTGASQLHSECPHGAPAGDCAAPTHDAAALLSPNKQSTGYTDITARAEFYATALQRYYRSSNTRSIQNKTCKTNKLFTTGCQTQMRNTETTASQLTAVLHKPRT